MQRKFIEIKVNLSKVNRNPYDLNTYSKSIRSTNLKNLNNSRMVVDSTSNRRVLVLADTLTK